jgi:serine/threonine protein kinase
MRARRGDAFGAALAGGPESDSPPGLGDRGFEHYVLKDKFGGGGQGEVWHAVRRVKRRPATGSSGVGGDDDGDYTTTDNDKKPKDAIFDMDRLLGEPPSLDSAESEARASSGSGSGARPGGSGGADNADNADRTESAENALFVLKRVFGERGDEVLRSGLREATFGRRLAGVAEVARFVEAFNRSVGNGRSELWLVFHHEGRSLDSILYSRVESGQSVFLEPSALWQRMRRDVEGARVRREIVRQTARGLAAVHARGLCHRDVKPSNLLVSESARSFGFTVKVADLGSAVDAEDAALNARLYGPLGPTAREETRWYRPPEAFLAAGAAAAGAPGAESAGSQRFPYLADDRSSVGDPRTRLPWHAFDAWSLGVVMLELLLGTPEVFALDARARARVDLELRGAAYLAKDPAALRALREMRYALRALAAFGIGAPGGKALLNATVRARDPFGSGFYFDRPGAYRDAAEMRLSGDEELDLVWQLLAWSPFDRPNMQRVLEHPYFAV